MDYTHSDKLELIRGNLTDLLSDNLVFMGGLGSGVDPIYNDKFVSDKDRTVDLHLFVNDTLSFYDTIFYSKDMFSKFGFLNHDKADIAIKLSYYNEKIPVYVENKTDGYRLTITPVDKLEEWLSDNSDVGYVLKARLRNAMVQLYPDTKEAFRFGPINTDNQSINEIISKSYDDATKLVIATSYGKKSLSELERHIIKLNYYSEGLRGFLEDYFTGKIDKVFQKSRDGLSEIYDERFKQLLPELNTSDKADLETTKNDAKKTFDEFKSDMFLRYTLFLYNIDKTFPNSDDYLFGKINRIAPFIPNKIIRNIVMPKLRNFQIENVKKLPEELIPKELKLF